MACKNDDGTLADSARALLEALEGPAAPSALAVTLGRPLFKVRSGLRELIDAGLVREEEDGRFVVTAEGREARAH